MDEISSWKRAMLPTALLTRILFYFAQTETSFGNTRALRGIACYRKGRIPCFCYSSCVVLGTPTVIFPFSKFSADVRSECTTNNILST